jgi:hypothetical protein
MPKWLKVALIILGFLIIISPVLASDVVSGFFDFVGEAWDNVNEFGEEMSN